MTSCCLWEYVPSGYLRTLWMAENKVRSYLHAADTCWEGKISSDNQELGRNVWNSKIHYWVHNSLPLFCYHEPDKSITRSPILFLKTHSNIILPSASRSFKWPLSVRFSYQKPTLLHTCHMLGPSHSQSYGSSKHINTSNEEHKSQSFPLRNFHNFFYQTDAK